MYIAIIANRWPETGVQLLIQTCPTNVLFTIRMPSKTYQVNEFYRPTTTGQFVFVYRTVCLFCANLNRKEDSMTMTISQISY